MSGTSSRVERRKQATRNRIFQVAMELFLSKGYEQTTVADISEAADVGKGTFFTYFPTKESLFGHLGQMMVDRMAQTIEDGLHSKPASVIMRDVVASTAAWLEENQTLVRPVIAVGRRGSLLSDSASRRRMGELLTNLIKVGQEQGEFDPAILPQDAAATMMGGYFTAIMGWHLGDQRTLGQRLNAGLSIVLRGLRPPQPTP